MTRKLQRDKTTADLNVTGKAGLECARLDRHSVIGSSATRSICMTQTTNRFFDEIGRLMNDAAGAAQGMKREVDAVIRTQAEKILNDLDIVKREEFEAVKEMARLAREENEALKARIAVLEGRLGSAPAGADAGNPKAEG
jgi:BMFP domain-containing protein YqiC